jgi:uncharacterized protein (TIGR02145 family)
MKINKLFFFAALLFFAGASSYAQVTIGGSTSPAPGVLLDLNSVEEGVRGGLLLSNVTIIDLEKIPFGKNVFAGITDADADVNTALCGTVVYNDGQGTTVPAGIYVWNGYYWTHDGNCNPVVTASSPLSVLVNAGTSTTLSVDAVGCDVIKYQWYEGSNVNSGVPINNATAKTFSTPTSLTVGYTYYYCKVSSYSNGSTLGETTSSVFTVKVFIHPLSLTGGSGTFIGATCLDVKQGNASTGGGPLTVRQETDFTDRNSQIGPIARDKTQTGVQVYTFTPSTGKQVSHVRFEYDEIGGVSIDSIVPGGSYATTDNISGACTVTVYYRKELHNELKDKTGATGKKLKLYAIYNSDAKYSTSSKDRVLGLTVSLQDGLCCGAYTDKVKGEWLPFMCYNLGATQTKDPFTAAQTIHGAKYKWGLKGPALTQTEDQNSASDNGISDWSNRGTPPSTAVDWDMSDANNPCPDGWRLPTHTEWINVVNSANNIWTNVGSSNTWAASTIYSTGYKFGDALFLPAAGRRQAGISPTETKGKLVNRGTVGYYWDSTQNSKPLGGSLHFYDAGYKETSTFGDRESGYSVRCVAK